MENETLSKRKIFTKIGYSLFGMLLAVMVAQTIISVAIQVLAPQIATSVWSIAILIGVPMYLIGFPVFLNMIRKVPNGPKGEVKKLSLGQMVVLFFISMSATYIFNIVGNMINTMIGSLKGSDVVNPLDSVINMSSLIPVIIFVVILSPIVEEIIFRGILLDKLRGYGDKTAIVFTAFTFALLHGNLSQFFYAFVLGLIFGYVALRTNTILYTIILHIIVNMFGSVIMPGLALSGNEALIVVAGALVIAFMLIGGILFIKNYKKIELNPYTEEIGEEVNKKKLYLNPGIILFYIASLMLFTSAILATNPAV